MLDISLRPVGLQKKCVQLHGTSSGNELSYDFRLIISSVFEQNSVLDTNSYKFQMRWLNAGAPKATNLNPPEKFLNVQLPPSPAPLVPNRGLLPS